MNAIDMMTTDPITIRAETSLRSALKLMVDNAIKHLPVLSQQGHVIGILSDRDCRYALNSPYTLRERWQDEELAIRVQVRTIMTSAPIIVEPQTSAEAVVGLMLEHRIGCLPVMRAETLVGIITRSDILIAFMTIHKHYEHLINLSNTPVLTPDSEE
ncbi:MAG: hypothetical protein Phog2KO_33280 [Phototrophicaceae bacterium]